jgi:RHS repeat-associated protein
LFSIADASAAARGSRQRAMASVRWPQRGSAFADTPKINAMTMTMILLMVGSRLASSSRRHTANLPNQQGPAATPAPHGGGTRAPPALARVRSTLPRSVSHLQQLLPALFCNQPPTTTAYIFTKDDLVATVQGTGLATTTRYQHADQLGSINVTTDHNGTLQQQLDYYPYGGARINTNAGTVNAERTYVGQFSDSEDGLSYLNARHYDANRGQFLSQDPTFLAIANPNELQRLSQQQQRQMLADPQQLNSYGYARSNPLVYKDPTGLVPWNVVFEELDVISNVMLLQSTHDYFTNSPTETPRERANDGAQSYADGIMFGAGVYAGAITPPGIALNTGGIVLYGLDKYCAGHECRNFNPGDRTPQETARAVIAGDPSYLPTRKSNSSTKQTALQLQQTVTQQFNGLRQSVASQISSLQSRINSIRAQLNAIIKQRANSQSKPAI